MKRKIGILLVTLLMVFTLVGCGGNSKNTEVKNEVANVEQGEKTTDNNEYILTIRVKQDHLSLDLNKHAKDIINAFEFDIPVDKEYYDSVSKGDVLNNDFRGGSFLTAGTVGKWDVSIEDKSIEKLDEEAAKINASDNNRYALTLKIEQDHFSLNPFKHAKDAINTITFEIPVTKSYYDSVEKDENITKDFRWGSLLAEGSIGNWKVSVKKKSIIE